MRNRDAEDSNMVFISAFESTQSPTELFIENYDQWSNPTATGTVTWCAYTYKDDRSEAVA